MEYEQLFEYLINNLKLSDFEVKDNTLGYRDIYIGNDMIMCPRTSFLNISEEVSKKSRVYILSYKNVIIAVHEISKEKYDFNFSHFFTSNLIDCINNYEEEKR